MKLYYQKIKTPLTTLHCYATSQHLIGIFFENQTVNLTEITRHEELISEGTNEILKLLEQQLKEYFEGARRTFEVPIKLTGSELQLAAWKQISLIPFGKTLSYAEQALAIGKPKAVRAVATANGQNRLPFIIPCHRVLRSDGSIGGYSGGTALKAKLLELERRDSF